MMLTAVDGSNGLGKLWAKLNNINPIKFLLCFSSVA